MLCYNYTPRIESCNSDKIHYKLSEDYFVAILDNLDLIHMVLKYIVTWTYQ